MESQLKFEDVHIGGFYVDSCGDIVKCTDKVEHSTHTRIIVADLNMIEAWDTDVEFERLIRNKIEGRKSPLLIRKANKKDIDLIKLKEIK